MFFHDMQTEILFLLFYMMKHTDVSSHGKCNSNLAALDIYNFHIFFVMYLTTD